MVDLASLFHELVRFETELWDAVDVRLRAECDLTLSRFEPMRVIRDRERCRVQDIAAELSITVGGVSKLVDRIETRGHCRRHAHPDDRRSSILTLTTPGRRLLARASRVVDDELSRQLLGRASEPELHQLLTIVRSLRTPTAAPG